MTNCLKIVDAMPQADQDALLTRLENYQAVGMTPKQAQLEAAKETLRQIEASGQKSARDLTEAVGKVDGVKMVFEDYTDDEVELVSLEAANKGKGAGTFAMRKITAAADKLGVNLMLITAGDQEKQDRLAEFYKRFGFDGGEVMRRPAIQKSQRSVLGFYSALSEGIAVMPTKQAMAGAWMSQIKGLVNKGVVKQDELEWSGLTDYLRLAAQSPSAAVNGNATPLEDFTNAAASYSKVLSDLSAGHSGLVKSDSRIKIPRDTAAPINPVLVEHVAVNPKSLLDLRKLASGSVHELGQLGVPAQRLVVDSVRAASHDGEIFRTIVELVPIDVMNDLTGQKAPTDGSLGNHTMFERALAIDYKAPIPSGVDVAISALIKNPAFPLTEVLLAGVKSGLRLATDATTVRAGEVRHVNSAGKLIPVHSTSTKISKEQITAYLDANGVQIEEVVRSKPDNVVEYLVYSRVGRGGRVLQETFRTEEEALDYVDEAERNDDVTSFDIVENPNPEKYQTNGGTKYDDYKLPGGTNYREVLLTLPEKTGGEVPTGWQLIDTAEEDRADGLDIPAGEVGPWRYKGPGVASKNYKSRDEALAALKRDAGDSSTGRYKSPHWEQPNVLAHLRVDDRTDADDNKVLFIEELQSDWQADGRKKGFVKDTTGWTVKRLNAPEAGLGKWQVNDADGNAVAMVVGGNEDSAIRKAAEGIPLAPFIDKTDKWLNLALKRVITMAVQGGYDKVALINGQQSADRYDLSKQVSQINYDVLDSGEYNLEISDINGRKLDNVELRRVAKSELDDVVGKELAGKIVAGDGQPTKDGRRVLSGLDLEIGGKGMKTFYDSIVPNATKALLKKLGGGQMESVTISQDHDASNNKTKEWDESAVRAILKRGGQIYAVVSSQEELLRNESDLDELMSLGGTPNGYILGDKQGSFVQTGFTITPALREKVSAGVPLFSKRDYQGNDAGETAEWKEALAKGLDMSFDARMQRAREMGFNPDEPWYHGTNKAFDKFKTNKREEPGVWFVSNPALASDYAAMHRKPGQSLARGSNVIPVLLRTRKFDEVDKAGEAWTAADHDAAYDAKNEEYANPGTEGVIFRHTKDYATSTSNATRTDTHDTAVVFQSAIDLGAVRSIYSAFDPEHSLRAQFSKRDLFGGFANKGTVVDTDIVISSKGDKLQGGNVDSAGRIITRTKQGLKNFWNWFGQSDAVDAKGKPLLLYHSTQGDISEFEIGRETVNNYGLMGDLRTTRSGIFATSDKDASEGFLRGDADVVMPVYMSLQKALDLRSPNETFLRAMTRMGVLQEWRDAKNDWEMFDNYSDGSNPFVDKLKEYGYDGAIFVDSDENDNEFETYVAFDKNQVKSALGNIGQYSVTNGNISKSAREYQANFEVAPDPNDKDLSSEWNALALADKQSISRRIAQVMVQKVLDAYGAVGEIVEQIGSYLEDTNPSFALQTDSQDVDQISKDLGYILSQDSMANFSLEPFQGSSKASAVFIKLGDKTFDEIQEIYNTIRSKVPQVSGQSYASGVMKILNVEEWSGVNTTDLTSMVDAALDGVYDTANKDIYYSFPEKKDYNHDSREAIRQEDGRSYSKGLGQTRDRLRGEASALIREAIDTAKRANETRGEIAFSIRPEASTFDDVLYKWQNKHIDTKRVVEAIKTTVGQLADDLNVYLQEELFHGRAAKRVADFGKQELTPLIEQIGRDGYTIADVEEYLHARHAEEANQVIARRNPNDPGLQDGGSGMDTAVARAYMAGLSAQDAQKLSGIAAQVDAIIKQTRQLYVNYSLESQDTVDAWDKMFQSYIPLQREEKEGGGMGIGQGFSVKGKETKGRTGSKRRVVDILANIALQREKLIVRGEKNRVATALVGLATANPEPDLWSVGPPPSTRVYDPKTNTVVERVDPMYKSRNEVLVAKVADANGKIVERAVVFNETDPRALRMVMALKNLDAASLEGLLGVSAVITRYFSASVTQWNPVFGLVNLVRDMQGAMINLGETPLAGDRIKIAKDTMSALAGIYADIRDERSGKSGNSKWSALWDEFELEGGQTGFRDLFKTSADRAEALQKILTPGIWMDSKLGKIFTANGKLKVPMGEAVKGAGWIFDWLSDYNNAMENGVRLATYKAGIDRGMSKQQAASLAKNLTVNFNRKGQAGQQAGAVYAFFNAAMQGTARMGQTLFTMQPGRPKTIRLNSTGKKVVYGGMLLGVIQAFTLAAAGFDDKDPPDFVKERSLVMPTGWTGVGPDRGYISIPMPLGFHVIPGIGRHATEFALSGFKKPAQRAVAMIGMFADAFNPIGNAGLSMQTITPTALDPIAALLENKDWTGKPIARTSSNKAMPGHTQWKDTASWLGKMASEGVNWITGGNDYVAGALSPTPDQIDYLAAQVGGGVWRELSKLEQSLTATATGEDLPIFKVPLAGRFFGNAGNQASQAGAFYTNTDKLNELETEVKGMRKDGLTTQASALIRSRPDAYMIQRANVAERQVQRLRREKRELLKKGAERSAIKAKEVQITETMRRFNEAMSQVSEAAP